MKAPEPTTQTRPRLNRQLVLRTVLEIIDREGLEALNMRRLGAELSADPMTIYHHAGKKEDLLAGVADLLWGEISPPEETASPTRNLGMLARSIRALFQRHPQAAPLLLRTYALSRSLLELMRRYLEALKRGDLGGRDRAAVLRSMVSYALGYGYTETSVFGLYCGPSDPAALPPAPTREEVLMYLGQALPPDTPPGLAETAKVMIADCNSDQCFEDGLELMLAALTQRSS